jgi:APA family basic amino acid/polyamine antiporter
MSDRTEAPDSAAARPFGLTSLICLVIASMIGAGVFRTSGALLSDLPSVWILLLWVVGGLIALCGAISYGGLARQIAESGGEYLFLSRAVHPLAGFLAGWISLVAGFSGALAFTADTLARYSDLARWVTPPVGGSDPPAEWLVRSIAVAIVILGAALHAIRIRPGAHLQSALVVLKIALLCGLIITGITAGRGSIVESWQTAQRTAWPVPPLTVLAMGLLSISFAYSGFNAAVYVAGEAIDPRRQVPRAMLWGTALVILLYVLLNYVFVILAPRTPGTSEFLAVNALEQLAGPWAGRATRAAIVLALVTSVSSLSLAGPRVLAQMAADGCLPNWLTCSPGHPPRAAIGLQAAVAIALLLSPIDLLSYTATLLSVSAAGTVACLLLPALRGIPGHRPVIAWPWPPLLFTLCSVAFVLLSLLQLWGDRSVSIRQHAQGVAIALILLAIGGVVYRFYAPRSAR